MSANNGLGVVSTRDRQVQKVDRRDGLRLRLDQRRQKIAESSGEHLASIVGNLLRRHRAGQQETLNGIAVFLA